MIAIDWTNIDFVGVFVVGVLAGVVLTIRVIKLAIAIVKREQEK